MAETIKVFPGVNGADLSHPSAGPIKASGSLWPQDQFTFRRLGDGSITRGEPDDGAAEDSKGTEATPAAGPTVQSPARRQATGPDKV